MINHVRIRHWSLRWSEIVSTWDIKDEMKNTAVKNGALRSIAHTQFIAKRWTFVFLVWTTSTHIPASTSVSILSMNWQRICRGLCTACSYSAAPQLPATTQNGSWHDVETCYQLAHQLTAKLIDAANSVSLAENDRSVTHLASSLRAGIIADISSPSMVSLTASVSCWEKNLFKPHCGWFAV